jgi:membrane fusion protein, multidrug efflux system
MSASGSRRPRLWTATATIGVAFAVALAGYGIWSRNLSVAHLQQIADDAGILRVLPASPKPGPAEDTLRLPGQVVAWNEAQIYGQVSGYVSEWLKDYGAPVQKGEVLATIDTPGLDAQYEASKAQLIAARTQFNIAALTAKRYNELTPGIAITQQTIDNMNASAESAKAQMEAAQQNVDQFEAQIEFKKLRSPFTGIVTARRVNVGDFINAAGADATLRTEAQPPFSVGDVSKLRIFVSVPQEYGSELKPGLKAELQMPGDPGKPIAAQFLTNAGAVQRATRTIVTEFVVDNPKQEGLLPGAYVDVKLMLPGNPDILVIPSQALLFRAAGLQVAVIEGGNRVRLQNVTLGRNLGLEVQIVAGLKATDTIVANPSVALLDGQQVKVVQAVKGYEPGEGQSPSGQPAQAMPAPVIGTTQTNSNAPAQ